MQRGGNILAPHAYLRKHIDDVSGLSSLANYYTMNDAVLDKWHMRLVDKIDNVKSWKLEKISFDTSFYLPHLLVKNQTFWDVQPVEKYLYWWDLHIVSSSFTLRFWCTNANWWGYSEFFNRLRTLSRTRGRWPFTRSSLNGRAIGLRCEKSDRHLSQIRQLNPLSIWRSCDGHHDTIRRETKEHSNEWHLPIVEFSLQR